ncbi:MAG: ABC-2 family transporter protein [Candidatus Paracaedibacteraceae bacterium]|nr:ABC-2 family transporter protein [Candidatus Paracaedibacteraceae bacterium]
MNFVIELFTFFEYIKINLKSSFSQKGFFISRIFFMIINNLIFFSSWYFFFKKFQVINGWSLKHISLMSGIVNISLGLNICFFNGLKNMPTIIESGQLDIFLTLPRSVLIGIAASSSEYSGIGSVVSGLFLLYFSSFNNFFDIILIVFFILISMIIFSTTHIFYGSLSFWFKGLNRLNYDISNILTLLATTPGCVYKGMIKTLIFSIIPIGFASYLPVEYFITKDISIIPIIILGPCILLFISIATFKVGLKKYESGNLPINLN